MPGMHGRISALTVLAAITLAAAAGPADKRARLEEIRQRISDIKARIADDRDARDDASEELAEIERRIGDIAERLHRLDESIAATRDRIDELTTRAEQHERQLQDRLGKLAGQIRAAYRVGRQGRLQMILSQDDPAQVGRLLAYYEYYADAQSQSIADVRSDLDALHETREKLSAKRQRLRDKRSQRRDLLASLESSRAERESTLKAIEGRLAERGDTLESLRADENRLEKLIDSLHKNLDEDPGEPSVQDPDTPFAKRKGRLTPPVSGRVIAGFGDAKAGGRLQWQGVWLAAPTGTAVTATASGRVVYVGWMHRYGLIVVLDHGQDYYTVYGHNQSVYVEVGDHVRAGDKLSGAGNSGGHDTSGVYFEIRRGRTPIDPANWLKS